MTDLRLAEVIRELWRELESADRAIMVIERIAGIRPRRGRPPKVRLSLVRRGPRRRR